MAGYRQSLTEELARRVLAIDEEGEGDCVDSGRDKSKGLNGDGLMEPKGSNTVDERVAGNTLPASSTPRKRKGRWPVKDGESVKGRKQNDPHEPPRDISLKDLGGIEEVYLHIGMQPPRGVILHGPPGCGKTMLANAFSAEVGIPFIAISAHSLVSGMSGESEKKLRELFEEAREKAPCLIFIDEIDTVTPKRDSSQREMEIRVVAQMLSCMEGLTLEKTGGKPVMIIGAANRPDSLDPALRRAGRFDREIYLNVPDEDGREKILSVLCKRLRLSGDFDFKHLAKTTPGFVGADLSALVVEAVEGAMERIWGTPDIPLAAMDPLEVTIQPDSLYVTPTDFLAALPKIQPSSKGGGSLRVEMQMPIVQPIKRPELFASVGITVPAGVLLWGPPGRGKTLLAQAVANDSGANFVMLLAQYVGESERAVRQVFSRARASIPCVIFFDELDALALRRDAGFSESASRVGIYVIAATNRPDVIDPALLRPGRLGKLLFVGLPNTEERVEILKTITKKTPLSNLDLGAVARDKRCKNFSGADLAALVREATILSLRRASFSNHQVVVTAEDFEKAFADMEPSVSEDGRKRYQEGVTTFACQIPA
ncbi:AAA-domain-containing protein [Tuber magnatum]|uniref:AAA-domain-containing protein n=1 Tax=Tuber magnatum TaxID=42249 RepID=A0A317SNI3_9PEZI|nr:AAA-domain-containing protein [Tuber magnatum]